MGTLPIDRLRAAWFRLIHGVQAGDAAKCKYCGVPVAPHEGLRDNGDAFCNSECAAFDFERLG